MSTSEQETHSPATHIGASGGQSSSTLFSPMHSAAPPEDELNPEDELPCTVPEELPPGPGTPQLVGGLCVVHPAFEPTQDEQNCPSAQLASPSRFAQWLGSG